MKSSESLLVEPFNVLEDQAGLGQMVPATSGHTSPPTTDHGSMSPPEQQHKKRRQHKDTYRRLHPIVTTAPNVPPKRGSISSGSSTSSAASDGSATLVPTALDAHRRDMFGAYPVQLDAQSLEALDEQLNSVSNEELVFDIRGGHKHPMLATVFSRSLQDVGLFSCYVAAAQSLFLQRRSRKGFQPSDQLMALQNRGLSHIRDRIMGVNAVMDDILIASITQLMVADSVCGNIKSLLSHQRGVRKLLGLRKDALNEPLVAMSLGVIVVIEFYMALVAFIFPPEKPPPPPADNALRYIKHPFPISICIRMSRLPQGLEDLALSSKCSLQTIDLLEHLSEWSSDMQAINGANQAATEVYARLFAEPMSSSRSAIFILRNLRHANAEISIEYVLCLGVIIIIKHQRTTRKTDYLDDELVHSFVRALKQYPHASHCEVAAIIWLVAVVAWRISGVFKPEADDLIDFTIKKYDEAQSLSTTRTIWRKFLWHERYEHAWTRMWQLGLDRYQVGKAERLMRAPAPKNGMLKRSQSSSLPRDSASLKKEDSNSSYQSSSNFSRPPSTVHSMDSVTPPVSDSDVLSG
ncbi:uncharacterized protein AB675_3362 [Cyphellophora attinorum]|uniref:Uncharacterized protein n=1 Tax=Cyphellophora attinorum TaxID=1664694 RepID=A0A0N0NLV0_9EURO|nr:uncharacterized protein AB675_3362 [Phialophora attinorum]KPI39721.1 hypothetical protein AB675_3362 [Phialophora attinorum]